MNAGEYISLAASRCGMDVDDATRFMEELVNVWTDMLSDGKDVKLSDDFGHLAPMLKSYEGASDRCAGNLSEKWFAVFLDSRESNASESGRDNDE